MKLFTFVVDKEGGTFCSQHSGEDFFEAALAFVDEATRCKYLKLSSKRKTSLFDDLAEAVPLSGLINVFCVTYLDGPERSWLINIIETVSIGEGLQNDPD